MRHKVRCATQPLPEAVRRTDTVSKRLTTRFEREPHMKFQMENHRITLAGRVATKADRRRAEQDVGCPDAIRGVVNRIQVRA